MMRQVQGNPPNFVLLGLAMVVPLDGASRDFINSFLLGLARKVMIFSCTLLAPHNILYASLSASADFSTSVAQSRFLNSRHYNPGD